MNRRMQYEDDSSSKLRHIRGIFTRWHYSDISKPKNQSEQHNKSWNGPLDVYGQNYAKQFSSRRDKNSQKLHRRNHRQRQRFSLSGLERLKARTQCLKCNECGQWRAGCPHRDLSMTDTIKSRHSRHSNNYYAAEEILLA